MLNCKPYEQIYLYIDSIDKIANKQTIQMISEKTSNHETHTYKPMTS